MTCDSGTEAITLPSAPFTAADSGEKVLGNRSSCDKLADTVVDIHDLRLWHRGDHLTKRSVHRFPIGCRSDAFGIDAANRLVVRLGGLLEELTVHGRAHPDHLVDSTENVLRRSARHRLHEQIRIPVN